MDKFEYKVKADEIKDLIVQGDYAQAAEIADTIDWRRVKSVMMLCTISDLYKINRRYEDAKNMLLLAYERRPGGRTICYSLCELCIKTEEFVQAVNYYKEFVQVAPKDSGRYILQYKLYEAQDVSLEERIGVLEELKKRDYREKWAYELAYLYHRVGLATRCVEECDELILWFSEGKYVVKAMELKMLHQPLSPEQQVKYNRRFEAHVQKNRQETEPPQTEDAQDAYGQQTYVQQESAEQAYVQQGFSGQAVYGEQQSDAESQWQGREAAYDQTQPRQTDYEQFRTHEASAEGGQSAAGVESGAPQEPGEIDIQVKTVDVGQYNTINLQAELAAGLQEVLRQDKITNAIMAPMMESDTETLDTPEIDEVDEDDPEPETEEEGTEVFFGETGEIGKIQPEAVEVVETPVAEEETAKQQEQADADGEATESEGQLSFVDETAELVMKQMRMESAGTAEEQVLIAQPPKELAGVLSQESDGQISIVLPERESIEKQITGQMNIQDILAEWERMKKENEEQRKEEVRQHVLQHTGNMFTEFEASVKDGLLEKLESDAAGESVLNSDEFSESEGTEETEEIEALDEFAHTREWKKIEKTVDISEIIEESDEIEEIEEIEESEEVGETEEVPEEAEPALAEEPQPEDSGPEAYEPEVPEAEAYEPEDVEPEAAEAEAYASEDAEPEVPEAEAYASEDAEPEAPETEAYGPEVAEPEDVEPEAAEAEAYESEDVESKAPEAEAIQKKKSQKKSSEKPPKPLEEPPVERDKAKVRSLTREEKELFAPFIQSRSAREQLVKAIDGISMAAYTGNVIITGEEGMDTMTLAKNMIRELQLTDSNFSGKVAKVSGEGLNQRNVEGTLTQLNNGALIIQKASGMSAETVATLYRTLQQETLGIIVVLEDTKKAINRLLSENPKLSACFTARMDMEALSNDTLVAFGRQYAREKEYSIDELGVLALHTRIEELQTIDHVVTVIEVKEIVDEAIRHANRKNVGHFFDVLFAKRYDDEDMIILTEKDFA